MLDPAHFKKSTVKSLSYAALDVTTVSLSLLAAYTWMLPAAKKLLAIKSLSGNLGAFALWSIYSTITGTLAIGAWVTGKELSIRIRYCSNF